MLLAAWLWVSPAHARDLGGFEIVHRLPAAEALQGVAADGRHLYAIGDRVVGKYDKESGARLARWQGNEAGRIIHLNGGVVIDSKLYCSHSNYPALPMQSSIEIFDTDGLDHVDSHALANYEGSATWVDRHAGSWWVAFANYAGKGGHPERGPQATFLARFDPSWNPMARYSFPPAVVDRFGTRSNSGGVWSADGLLYATGHDAAEIYVLRLPRDGNVLDLVEIVPAAIAGQGIALDPTDGTLWGILKATREVIHLRRGPQDPKDRSHDE
jgi:hypothetical protein